MRRISCRFMGGQEHNMYLLMGWLLFSWLSTEVSAESWLNVTYIPASPAVLVGGSLIMSCSSQPFYNLNWRSVDQNRFFSPGKYFFLHSATIKDSGQYQCVYENNSLLLAGRPVTLTVVELLPPVWVTSDPVKPIILEGHEVSLQCSQNQTNIQPLSWVWKRKGVQDVWEKAGEGRGLVLTRTSQTGIYRCQVTSNTSDITQEQISPDCNIIIISLPVTISYHVGVAGLTLALLALLLLAFVFVRMWRLRTNETATLQDLVRNKETAVPHQSTRKEIPSKSSKRGQKPDAEVGEVYINCETVSKAYCDLDTDQTTGEDIYDTLD